MAMKISGRKFKRTNAIAAKCCDKIVAPMIYDGMTDSLIFEYWFETILLKAITRYSVIILELVPIGKK